MSQPAKTLKKTLLEDSLRWFLSEFNQQLVNPIGSHFPNFQLLSNIQEIIQHIEALLGEIGAWPGEPMPLAQVDERLRQFKADPLRFGADPLRLIKQIILRFRRHRAAETEHLIEKTFHLKFTEALEQDFKTLDALVAEEWFRAIETLRLPRLGDFLPAQFVEDARFDQVELPPRQHDEKFHILQAPNLFLPDLAYFRAKCEDRERPLAIAFLDIDHFKKFNTKYTETKVDRNLLPRFMQTIEAHVFHHGYAYRQGGDEYLVLIPSLSRKLAIAFLDELRGALAELEYPDIEGNTTVSIGLCIVEPDCPLTDRELRHRASEAEQFAKYNGRNCIASYDGQRFIPEELRVVKP